MLFGKKDETEVATVYIGNHSHENADDECEFLGHNLRDLCLVRILGTGHASCQALLKNALKAIENTDIGVEYITDKKKVASFGINTLPVLIVNDKVVSAGRVLSHVEIGNLIKQYT